MSFLGWLRNSIDFPLRQAIRLHRPGARLPAEPKDGLFPPAAGDEVRRLVTTYRLQRWEQEAGRVDFAASLFYLQMLERALDASGVTLPNPLRALDAGCGDWFYVQSLYGLLRHFGSPTGREVSLDGVELDAYALYEGFHSRYDWALAHAGGLSGAKYLPGDLLGFQQPVQLAVMLFPFLFADEKMMRWGLPRKVLRPAHMLRHVASLVEPGGHLVIANLGEREAAQQNVLLDEAGLRIAWQAPHESPLFHYAEPPIVTVVQIGEPGRQAGTKPCG